MEERNERGENGRAGVERKRGGGKERDEDRRREKGRVGRGFSCQNWQLLLNVFGNF